ncbi:MAG: hypothetical protein WBD31_21930 [Rubripirellula sp.]
MTSLRQSNPAVRRGVVTATDANLFRDLRFMVESIRKFGSTPICVYDLGMRHDQLNWCLRQPNLICRPVPPMPTPLADYVGKHRWQAWLKPTYIDDGPLDQILWIDADCVVLSPLDEAFDLIDQGPLLMPEVAVGCGANHTDLYRKHLPIDDVDRRCNAEMNNGVIGFDVRRDRELLDAWIHAFQWAVENPESRHLMRWYDQGALLWAVLHTENETRLQSCHKWNWPACAGAPLLEISANESCSLIDAIARVHPEASIVHYFGLVKLSIALDDEIHQRFLGATA